MSKLALHCLARSILATARRALPRFQAQSKILIGFNLSEYYERQDADTKAFHELRRRTQRPAPANLRRY